MVGRREWAMVSLLTESAEGKMAVGITELAVEGNKESESMKLPACRLLGVRGRFKNR